MNNLPITKITYIYPGFGEQSSTREEQVKALSYMTINTDVSDTYNSLIILNVANENMSYQCNCLYYVNEAGFGSPINSLTYYSIEHIGDEDYVNTSIVYNDRQFNINAVEGYEQDFILSEQHSALNEIANSVNNILSIINDRSNVLGISLSSAAENALTNATASIYNAKETIDSIVYKPKIKPTMSEESSVGPKIND